MAYESDLQRMTIADLAHRCEEQTDLYRQRQVADTRFCYELFVRAIRDDNQHAWTVLVTQYHWLISGWVRKHPLFEATGEEPEVFVNGTFARFAAAMTPDRLAKFPNLATLLGFLKTCTHGDITDCARKQARHEHVGSLPDPDLGTVDPEPPPDEQVRSQMRDRELWDWLAEHLSESELLVMEERFKFGLPPRVICKRHPDLFDSAADISRILQNVIARLKRNQDFRGEFGEID